MDHCHHNGSDTLIWDDTITLDTEKESSNVVIVNKQIHKYFFLPVI